MPLPTLSTERKIKYENTTMCIIHKGFRGIRFLSYALNLVGKLIGLKSAIPYEIIHQPLAPI